MFLDILYSPILFKAAYFLSFSVLKKFDKYVLQLGFWGNSQKPAIL